MNASKRPNIDIGVELRSGVAHHQAGNYDQAEKHYQRILAVHSDHADALHLSGLIEHQRGNHQRAIRLIKAAIQNFSNSSFYHNNLGAIFKETGAMEDAIACYQKALQLQPDYAEAAYNLGSLLLIMGHLPDAMAWFETAIKIKPDYQDALSNLAAACNKANRPDDAILHCEKVLSLNPDNAVALNNLGNALLSKKRSDKAIACFQRSIDSEKNNPEAHSNLGNALHDLGQAEHALNSYKAALALDPMYGQAYNNMGIVLREMGRLKEAANCYRKAIQLRPEDSEAYHNMGNILKDQGQLNDAIAMYRNAIRYHAQSIDSHVNLGIALEDSGQAKEAIQSYLKALDIDPDYAKAYSHLVHQLLHVCAWDQLGPFNERLDELTMRALEEGEKPDEMPFLNLIRHAQPLLNYRVASAWSREVSRKVGDVPAFYAIGKNQNQTLNRKTQKITLGYISNNFKNHPTAHLVQGMFQYHDRSQFNVFCYSYGKDDKSRFRDNIKTSCDRFIDIREMDHIEAARRINDDGVDILIDLVGYMAANRLNIPAMRPAPIQVRWLGMAGTTGADFFDYLITDQVVSPEAHSPFYSEALVYMPDCYQINDNAQPLPDGGITRRDAGLPEAGVVLCSFCSRYKYDPVMFRVWLRILDQVEGSVLWLLGGNVDAERNLRQFAASNGVNCNRLIFANKIQREAHLQRLQLADVALDTRIVNGAITTSDALWAGVPLVTLQGDHFASRMSSSILSAAQLAELVTYTIEDYEGLCVRLATEPHTLNEIRQHLRRNRLTMPLFDTQRFVQHLESVFLKMVEIYSAGDEPRLISFSKKMIRT